MKWWEDGELNGQPIFRYSKVKGERAAGEAYVALYGHNHWRAYVLKPGLEWELLYKGNSKLQAIGAVHRYYDEPAGNQKDLMKLFLMAS